MLKEKIVKALAWQSGAKFVSQVFSFAVTILLARILLPADFGLVGMALVFTGFFGMVNELGIGSSIIRKQDTTSQELSSVFWFAILFGGGFYLLTYVTAPLIGRFYDSNDVVSIVRVLGLNLIVGSLRTVPFSLLSRELLFAERSRAEIVSAIIGGTTALILAYLGFGVWSLVLNTLVAEVVLVLLCFWFSGWKPALVFRFSYAWEMLVFGIKIMGSRIQWYMYSNADYLLVGRMLGKDMLGHYTMAFRLATLPTEKVTAVVNQVMFPAFSQLQNDLPSLCQAFLKTTSYVSLITFPLLAIIAAFAPEIVVGLLTDKWLPSVFPLRVLCVIGLLRSVDVIIPQVLVARGRATLIFKYTTLLMCVLPASFAAGCYLGGINGVAYAWMLAYPPLSACLMFFGLRELELPLMRYVATLLPQLLGAAVMVLFLLTVKMFLLQAGIGSNLLLAGVGMICGLFIYLGYLAIFHGELLREVIVEIKALVVTRTVSEVVHEDH